MLETEVAVIGGGIQGAGVAQAAAAAGYSAMLFEKTAWAAGTSSRSSKLIHGGLRYLETGQINLVRQNLDERELLLRNAPELVNPIPFYIPLYTHSKRRPWQIHLGLAIYRLLARLSRTSEFHRLDRRAWRYLDDLKVHDLKAVFQYWDAQTDDRMLTRAVVKSAMDLGAQAFCPAELIRGERNADGYRLLLTIKGKPVYCQARTVVNAAGPWVNEVQNRLDSSLSQMPISLVRGAHILLPGTLVKGIYYLQSPIDDRPFFATPWRDGIMLGTTEVEHVGSLDEVSASAEEIDYLQRSFAHYFPEHDTEVLDSFAGLRVLPATPTVANRRSRDTIFRLDCEDQPHTLAIYGGKLTGYRHTGEAVLARLKPTLGEREALADTRSLRIKPA